METTEVVAKVIEVEATPAAVVTPDPNDLEKLVTEAVKKALAGQEVSGFSDNLVSKVVKELKPTLASGSLASSSTTPDPPLPLPSTIGKHVGVPSSIAKCVYNPTPIAELKKRHIPIASYVPTRESKVAPKRKTTPERSKSWLSLIHGSGNNYSTNAEAYNPISIGSSDTNSMQSYVPTARSGSSPANSYDDSNSNEYFPKKSKEEYLPKVKKRREEYVPRRVKHPLKTVQQLEETMDDETVLDEFAKKFETIDNMLTVARANSVVASNEESQEYVDLGSKFSDEESVDDNVVALKNEVRELKEQVSKIKYQEEKENTDVVQVEMEEEEEEEKEPLSLKSSSSTSHKKEHFSNDGSKSRSCESKKGKSRSDKSEGDLGHKEKSKDSHSSKSKDSKSKSNNESRSKDKHSSSKSKEQSSSSRDKDRGKEKEKDRDKEKEKDRDKDKEKEKDRSKDSKKDLKESKSKDTKDVKSKSKKDSRTDKEKEKESSRDSRKDKHKSDKYDKHRSKSSSSSSKTDKHKSHKSEEKHHSNHKSSSSNHKHSSSSKKSSKPKESREKSESVDQDRDFGTDVDTLHFNFEDEEPMVLSDSDHDVEEECLKIFQVSCLKIYCIIFKCP